MHEHRTYIRLVICGQLWICEYNGARFDMSVAFVWIVAIVE